MSTTTVLTDADYDRDLCDGPDGCGFDHSEGPHCTVCHDAGFITYTPGFDPAAEAHSLCPEGCGEPDYDLHDDR